MEDDGKGNPKKDDKGNYVFKKDAKGNLVPALTYKVEVDDEGRSEIRRQRQLGLRQGQGRQAHPGRHLQGGSGQGRQPQEGRRRPSRVRKRPGRQVHPRPEGAEPRLPTSKTRTTTRTYFPDDKGVYVADPARQPLAITDSRQTRRGPEKADFDNYVAALNKDVASYEAGSYAQTAYYRAADDKGQPTGR